VKKLISVRQALEDPAWLGSMLGAESFAVMRTLLIAAMGEALTAAENAHIHPAYGPRGNARRGRGRALGYRGAA
jgi:hypothetical protein